ncbi:MAG: hypothetical protein J6330_01525 [Clostridia bacterium]|nr:hypothetical protein [Clostridia bacterium]
MVKRIITLSVALPVILLVLTSCAVRNADAANTAESTNEATTAESTDEAQSSDTSSDETEKTIIEGFTVEKLLVGHAVNIKRIIYIPVGEGEGKVGGYKTPGYDYCVSNISFTKDGGICVTDTVGKKLEIYSADGKHLESIPLDPHDDSDRKLYYAQYTESGIYAIYDHTNLYRFDGKGGVETLDTSGDYYQIDTADDGSVYLYCPGSTFVCAPGGKPELCQGTVPGVSHKRDKNNFRHITGVNYYDTDCVLHEFNVELDYSALFSYAGLLNGMLVVQDGIPSSDGIEAPIYFFTAYT